MWRIIFFRTPKKEKNEDGKLYAVYMTKDQVEYYVCDMLDSVTEEAKALNELGLTLRSRLCRSSGRYAMLRGSIFNPERLINAACVIQDYKTKEFKGGDYKAGYTLLTITADGCTNEYMIYSNQLLASLMKRLKMK